MDGYPVCWCTRPGKENPQGEEQELWGMGLLTAQEMADLEHSRVALHFFSNATQNPLPPGGMPSGGVPEQNKLYLHGGPRS